MIPKNRGVSFKYFSQFDKGDFTAFSQFSFKVVCYHKNVI